MTKLIEFEY